MKPVLNIEEKVVFAVAPGEGTGETLILFAIPEGAWNYMRDGKTHTFDLTKLGPQLGLNIKLVLYGASTHADALKTLTDACRANGIALDDQRGKDFSI